MIGVSEIKRINKSNYIQKAGGVVKKIIRIFEKWYKNI